MAAVLACGETAVVSHESAAELHGIRKAHPGPVHVTVARSGARRKARLTIHRAELAGDEVTRMEGIPVTTVKRTIQDLATTLPRNELERTIEQAQIQRSLSLTDAVDGRRGKRGATALRAATQDGPRFTRSEAERRLLELVKRAGLPRPETNVRIGRWEVDALWRAERVVVEVDGYTFHSSSRSFERDRRKQNELQAMGLSVLRVTWRQLEEVVEVVARLSAALASAHRRDAVALPGSPPHRWPR